MATNEVSSPNPEYEASMVVPANHLEGRQLWMRSHAHPHRKETILKEKSWRKSERAS